MADYFVSEGALKLKGGVHKKKKKSKKTKEHKHLEAHTSRAGEDSNEEDSTARSGTQSSSDNGPRLVRIEMTKAEQTFKKMQEKKRIQRIMEKASKSHRQRVEEFNAKLDNLSEHYDIPKVSWTK